MKRDFTKYMYESLLKLLLNKGYAIRTFEQYLSDNKINKFVILRHDVDKKPENALIMAQLENQFGIKASYYFRIVKHSNDPKIIESIAELGHEIGYHYEDLNLAKGDYGLAIDNFEKNLNYFRKYYPIKTICMHGSPLSKWDNRLIWNNIDYRDYGILGEPYFDIDFNKVIYLTDTGRKWNATNENIRDKVNTNFAFDFKSTFDVIDAIEKKELPDNVMINVHPQRWTNNKIFWLNELVMQKIKNFIKRYI